MSKILKYENNFYLGQDDKVFGPYHSVADAEHDKNKKRKSKQCVASDRKYIVIIPIL
jgi:hypothetical protein